MAGKSGVHVVVLSNRLTGAVQADIKKAVAVEIERSARTIEGEAKQKVAVDTGTLRRSINTKMASGGLSATVAAGTNYGRFVEFGTRRMGARPFLIPAFEREKPKLIAAIRRILG